MHRERAHGALVKASLLLEGTRRTGFHVRLGRLATAVLDVRPGRLLRGAALARDDANVVLHTFRQLRAVSTRGETHVCVDVHLRILLSALPTKEAGVVKAFLARLLPSLRADRRIDRVVQLVKTDILVNLDLEQLEKRSAAETEHLDRLVVVELSSIDEEALVDRGDAEAIGDLRSGESQAT